MLTEVLSVAVGCMLPVFCRTLMLLHCGVLCADAVTLWGSCLDFVFGGGALSSAYLPVAVQHIVWRTRPLAAWLRCDLTGSALRLGWPGFGSVLWVCLCCTLLYRWPAECNKEQLLVVQW